MPRTSPRVQVALPAFFESDRLRCETLITDICMGGAFIKSTAEVHMELHAPAVVHCNLDRTRIQIKGKILRKHNAGYAVGFYDIGREQKRELWDYISSNLLNTMMCPFCNEKLMELARTCHKCDWNLSFKSEGYFDYYEKTSMIKKISNSMTNLEVEQLYKLEQFLEDRTPVAAEPLQHAEESDQEFVGTCSAMLDIFTLIRKVAPTEISVLITGESGTGKEMTAETIHERSARKDKPFVAINCGAIPENLLESELFGHEKGAFTGAHAAKKGKFECADGGTIFLDEIGEMPLALQVKLLRFLQDRKVERVGGVSAKKVDIRVLAATNCEINAAIAEGRFRSDLYYRLNEFTIHLPPIREREDDKIVLAKYYLNKFCRGKGLSKSFSSDAVDAIMSHEWPGNVREIINRVRRAIVMGSGHVITSQDMDLKNTAKAKSDNNVRLSQALAKVEKESIRGALNTSGNNISLAAAFLGITRQTLHRRMKLLGIKRTSELLQ